METRGVQLTEAVSKLWEQEELPFLKLWGMAKAGAHISAQTRKVQHFLNYFSSVSPWRWRHLENSELTSCGGMQVWWEGHQWHFTAHCCVLTFTVPWKTPLLSKPKQKEQQPSKLNIWVSKKKKLLMFYSIHATARERKQRTCSGMKDTLVPVLLNLISEGPDKLEEAIKGERVGCMQCQLHPWRATFLLQRKDRNTLL